MPRSHDPDLPAAARTVTDPAVFLDRRRFLQAAALGAAGASSIGAACARDAAHGAGVAMLEPPLSRPDVFPPPRSTDHALPASVPEALTAREEAAAYNNFYEFLNGRAGPVWRHVGDFVVEPWTIEVTGACAKPRTFTLDDLFAIPHEERLYHFRCVERWAMNVPWCGFPLARLLEQVEPTSAATHVRFETAKRRDQMPGMRTGAGPWPYFEGLRLDEAMHDLAMLVTGVYGRPLLKQHGAPARIIVPWKYGYKSPKSIVRIELLDAEPQTYWRQLQPHEYGFLSNVNPNVPHPRWSQSRSYMLGVDRVGRGGFDTPIFNGYAEQVASLYPDEPTTPQAPLARGQVAR